MSKPDPIFVNGLVIREHKFANGGSVLKVSVLTDKLKAFLDGNTKPSGWCNIVISKNRNPTEKSTHYATLDVWEPKQQTDAPKPEKRPPPVSDGNYANPPSEPSGDDVPF